MHDATLPDDPLATARVSPLVPLALLETLRSSDTPDEMLEDEELGRSFPRRLGLSDAVSAQIGRYRELQKRRAWLGGAEMADLLELVARRSDSNQIFERAGQSLLRRSVQSGRLGLLRSGLAAAPLPATLRIRLALQAARKAARKAHPTASEVRTELEPPTLVVVGSVPAALGSPDICRMTGGVLEAAFEIHGAASGDAWRVRHPECEARDATRCEWRVED